MIQNAQLYHAQWLALSQQRPTLRLLPPALTLLLCWVALWLLNDVFTQHWPFQVLMTLAFLAFAWALYEAFRSAPNNRQFEARSGRSAELLAARREARSLANSVSPQRQALIVLAGALLFQLVLLPASFAFSDDIFRYVWDGRVSAAGIDPYRYPPGDAALSGLRDEAIWPHVNAKEQPSPYPPMLETTFAAVYRLVPESLLAMKVAMVALNLGVVGLLLLMLWRTGQPLFLAMIYAWNPQVIFQVGFSGHNEPLLLFWLLLALLVGDYVGAPRGERLRMQPGRPRPAVTARRMLGAWALGIATMAKAVPLLVLPLVLRRWGWRAAVVYVATIGAAYGALLLRGQQVFAGVLYEADAAQFNDGAHYLLYRGFVLLGFADAHTPARLVALALLGLVLLMLLQPWEIWRAMIAPAAADGEQQLASTQGRYGWLQGTGEPITGAVGVLLAAYVVLTPSVAPWYALWVLPFVVLDVLPRAGAGRVRPAAFLVGSYWLVFSWSVSFSELYYFERGFVWPLAHTLGYLLPLVVCGAFVWRYRQRQRRSAPDGQLAAASTTQPEHSTFAD